MRGTWVRLLCNWCDQQSRHWLTTSEAPAYRDTCREVGVRHCSESVCRAHASHRRAHNSGRDRTQACRWNRASSDTQGSLKHQPNITAHQVGLAAACTATWRAARGFTAALLAVKARACMVIDAILLRRPGSQANALIKPASARSSAFSRLAILIQSLSRLSCSPACRQLRAASLRLIPLHLTTRTLAEVHSLQATPLEEKNCVCSHLGCSHFTKACTSCEFSIQLT